ncbi:hypothetical protein [Dyella flagellata]|nr:hypothetical protein [Dyella flagellata]
MLLLAVVASGALGLSACGGGNNQGEARGDTSLNHDASTPHIATTEDRDRAIAKMRAVGFWDVHGMKVVMNSDTGQKLDYQCTVQFVPTAMSQYDHQGITHVVDLPDIGVKRKDDNTMVFKASSAQAANRVIEAGGRGMTRAMCVPSSEDLLDAQDFTHSLSDFVNLTSINIEQAKAYWYAYSGQTIDYEGIAGNIAGGDVFQHRSAVAAKKPIFDGEVANAKAHPYVFFNIVNGLQHYDLVHKAFPTTLEFGNSSLGQFVFTPNATFDSLPVADEGKAREIESYVTHIQVSTAVYGKIVRAESNGRLVVVPMVVQFKQSDKVIGSITANL